MARIFKEKKLKIGNLDLIVLANGWHSICSIYCWEKSYKIKGNIFNRYRWNQRINMSCKDLPSLVVVLLTFFVWADELSAAAVWFLSIAQFIQSQLNTIDHTKLYYIHSHRIVLIIP